MKTWYLSILCIFLTFPAHADTITLKNEKQLKGLIVEQHADRIVLSTEKGEVPIFLAGITNIQYDDPAQNFYQAGAAYEKERKWGEALAYYEKAIELNPQFKEAQTASVRVRNHFWHKSTEGPRGEVEKRQLLSDAWGTGRMPKKGSGEDLQKTLKDRLGIKLQRNKDWNSVTAVESGKPFGQAGIRVGDELVSIDGQSLRFLNVPLVTKKLLEAQTAHMVIQVQRDCTLALDGAATLEALGLDLRLEYDGLVIAGVIPDSAAHKAGLKDNDLLMSVNGAPTRYTPMGKVRQMIEKSSGNKVVFSVRKNYFVMPK